MADTVIDALVVTLGLDPSAYVKGQEQARQQTEALRGSVTRAQADMARAMGLTVEEFKAWQAAANAADQAERRASANITQSLKRTGQEATRVGKEMEAGGKTAAQFFSQAKIEALGLIGTLVGAGGMAAFLGKTTVSLAELGRAARNIGVSPQALNAFQNVVERNGGSAESATASMKGLVDQIERFKVFGDPAVFKFLNPIGANISDSPLAIWQKFVEFADKHRNDPALVNLIGQGLGFDQGLINVSLQLKGAADATKQLGDEMGRVPTAKMIADAVQLQKDWEDLAHQAKFTGTAIESDYFPALHAVATATTELLKNREVVDVLTGISAVIAGMAAIRITGGLLWLVGLRGLGAAIAGLPALLMRLFPLLSTLALSGDTPDHTDPVPPGGEFFGENGPLAHWWARNMPSWLGGAPAAGGASPTHTADVSMAPEKRAFLDTLAAGEAGPEGYNSANPTSSARGRYQFLASTDADVSRQTGITGNDPVSQDRKAWFLASGTYLRNTGRDLDDDLRAGGHEADIAAALKGVWPSLPGGSQQNTTQQQFLTRLHDNLAAYTTQATATGTPGAPAAPGGTLPIPPVPTAPSRPSVPAIPPVPLIRLDPALVPQPGGSVSNSTTSNQTTMSIGTIVVHSQATDATGIANDIHGATTDAFVQQANRGLQ